MNEKGKSVKFINGEILPGPENTLICFFYIIKTARDFSEIQRGILELIMSLFSIQEGH